MFINAVVMDIVEEIGHFGGKQMKHVVSKHLTGTFSYNIFSNLYT